MTSLFSKLMDYQVDSQFRKDPGGRLVFFPLGLKGKGYFVDSKSDEEKIRSFVKLYRISSTLISQITTPAIWITLLVLESYATATPLRDKVMVIGSVGLLFLAVFLLCLWILWSVYQKTVPGFTSSLGEIGSDLKGQLSKISEPPPERRQMILVCVVTGFIVLGVVVLATAHYNPALFGQGQCK